MSSDKKDRSRMKDRFLGESSSRHYSSFQLFLYELLDQFLVLFVVSPAAVLVWRGSWTFFDEYLFSDDALVSGWTSAGIGYAFITANFLAIEWKGEGFRLWEKYREWRLYMYPLSVAIVHSWRGVWILLDVYLPDGRDSLWISHVVSFAVLAITKTVSNSMFIPSFYASDRCVTPFQIGTAFGTANTRCSPLYKVLDYSFTMIVVTVATIAFWRSSWMALNVYVFPEHEAFSNFLSIIIGYTIIISFKLVERHLKAVASCGKVVTFVLQAAFCYSMGFASINLWRGTWQMIGMYVFPDHVVPMAIISHCIGMFTLYVSRSMVNLIGCPCGTRVDSLETLCAFDTSVGRVIHLAGNPRVGSVADDVEKGGKEFTSTKKRLIVSTSSEDGNETATTVIK